MGVENRHPQYDNNEYQWRQMRDTIAGSSAVKRSGSLYLPIPAAMIDANAKRASISQTSGTTNGALDKDLFARAPWNHNNKFYSDYLQRARFPDITSLSLRALLGIATKKKPVIELPSTLKYLENNATPEGWTLEQLYVFLVAELLSVGRAELLVDVRGDGNITFVPYVAESFTNWKEGVLDGEKINMLSVLNETDDVEDEFDHTTEQSNNYLVLRLEKDENDKIAYSCQKYKDGAPIEDGKIFPNYSGRKLDRIPLVVGNATNTSMNVSMSPLIGISDVAVSIYQKDADMSQSEYLSCNPWLVFIGIDADDAPKSVGSQLAYVIENADGDAKYVEPTASSLNHMQNRIEKLFEEGLKYGVALLSNGSAKESTETYRMRQESQGATLRGIVKNAQEMIIDSIDFAIKWTGPSSKEYRFEPNMEFSEHRLQPNELKELLNALIENTISYETFFENLQSGGIISEDKDYQDELDQIANNPPLLGGASESDMGGDDVDSDGSQDSGDNDDLEDLVDESESS